jgi:Spy/CpxP family protein refolding chaperone
MIQLGLAALVVAAVFASGHAAFALQRPGGPGFGRRGPGLPRLEQLARQLDLTEAQRTQIQGILGDARSKLEGLRTNTALTREERMDQAQQIASQTREQIRGVLTPDQQLKADELRQQAEQRFGERRERVEERMLGRLTQQLDLSESQQSTIQLYLQDRKTQLDALKGNNSLTASQKREQMQFIRQQTQEKIRSVLTAEQQAQLDELRDRFQDRAARRPRRGPRFGRGGPGI